MSTQNTKLASILLLPNGQEIVIPLKIRLHGIKYQLVDPLGLGIVSTPLISVIVSCI